MRRGRVVIGPEGTITYTACSLGSPYYYSGDFCTMSTLSGNCFCGEVKFEVTGAPAAMGYCHCESCRRWSAGPVNAFSLWKPESLKITHGVASVGTYNKTPISYLKCCTKYRGHVFTEHP